MSRFEKFAKSMFETGHRRTIDNLYSGVTLSGRGKKAAVAGLAGYGAYMALTMEDQIIDSRLAGELEYQKSVTPVTSLPGTYGDGQDYMSRLRDMQAQSDLVFALDKLKGGRDL